MRNAKNVHCRADDDSADECHAWSVQTLGVGVEELQYSFIVSEGDVPVVGTRPHFSNNF